MKKTTSAQSQSKIIPVALQLIHNNRDIFHTFPEMVDALEIFFVLNDLKPACRLMLHEDKYPQILEFCKNNNLHLELSGFKIIKDHQHLENTRQKNRALMVKTNFPQEGEYFMYFSKNAEEAKLAKFYEHIRNDEKLGEILGYPKCCVNFYRENYSKAAQIGDEYCFFSIANTKVKPSYLTNNMLRFFGVTLLSHFPCSYDCVHSTFQAKQRIEAIRRSNPELAKYFEDTLKGPVIAEANSGVHALKHYKIDGKKVFYKNVWLTSPNPMHNILAKGNRIDILGKNHIKIMHNSHIIHEQKGNGIAAVIFE